MPVFIVGNLLLSASYLEKVIVVMLGYLRQIFLLSFLFPFTYFTGHPTQAREINENQHLLEKMNAHDTVHFLNRVAFGSEPRAFKRYFGVSKQEAINDVLLGIRTSPVTPLPEWTLDPAPPFWGRNDMQRGDRNLFDSTRTKEFESLKHWWVGEIAQTNSPLTERLVLFWHNHFVSAYAGLSRRSVSLIRQNQSFRKYAGSSFKTLLTASLQDPALLRYLDNDKNKKGRPNENLGRELLELFTLGEGKFSERDVKEVSRSLTGWRIYKYKNLSFWDDKRVHDRGQKIVFGKRGRFDQKDIIELLLKNPRTSEFITEKFWRYFVSETWQDKKVIKKIAKNFKENDCNLMILLRQILSSEAFWSSKSRGTIIKSPVDFVLGTIRSLQVSPTNFALTPQILKNMGQELFNPPNVGGWPGYSSWVTPSGIIERVKYIKDLTAVDGFISDPDKINNIEQYFKYLSSNPKKSIQRKDIKHSRVNQNELIADSILTAHTRGFNKKRPPVLGIGFINAKVGQRIWKTLVVMFEVRKGRGLRIKFRGSNCDPICFAYFDGNRDRTEGIKPRKQLLNIDFSDSFEKVLRKLKRLDGDEKRMVAILAGSLDEIADLLSDGRRFEKTKKNQDWVKYLNRQARKFKKKKWIKSLLGNYYELKTSHGYQPPKRDMNMMMGGVKAIEGIMPGGVRPIGKLLGWRDSSHYALKKISLAQYFLVVPQAFRGGSNNLQNILTSPAYNVR